MQLSDALPRNFGELAAFLRAAYLRFTEDRCLEVAGSLTYTTLLALVPLLTVALAVITAFPVFGAFTSGVDDWLAQNVLPRQISRAIPMYLAQFAEKAAQLTAVEIVFLAVTALLMMLTIDQALNGIFRVHRERPIAQRLLMYWAVLTLGPILIGLSLSMTSYLVSISLGLAKGLPLVGELLLRVVPFLLTSTALTLLYLWVPYRRVHVEHAVAGGLVAGVLFELMQRGFGLYVARFPTYTAVYGAFAAVPIFLVWLYFSWVVVLLGATFTALLPGYYRSDRRGGAAGQQFYDALSLLERLMQAQRAGAVLPVAQLARDLRLAPEMCERVLARMEKAGWVAQAGGERWVLARDAGSLAATDVYRLFVLDARAGNDALATLVSEHQSDVARRMQISLNELFPGEKK